MTQGASPTINGSSTMAEVLAAFPGAQRALFKKYHIGGCSSCGFQPTETLEQLCQRNNQIPVHEVVAHIQLSHLEDAQREITAYELAAALKNGKVRVVDIRTREEHEAVKIPGAVLLSQELLQEMLMRWNRGELVVLYDHQGRKSQDAAAYFQGHGFTQVKCLRGGIDAYSTEVDSTLPRYRLES